MINKGISLIGIFFLSVLSLLPLRILYILADGSYFLLFYIFKYRRRVVRENLLNALPDISFAEITSIEKKYYRYLSSLVFEVIKMTTISKTELNKRFIFRNKEGITNYLKNGQSVLICSAHYGNWEWGTLALSLNFPGDHYPIYKPLSNPIFDRWFKSIRSRFGNHLVAMRQTMRALALSKGKPSTISFGNDQAPARHESHYWTTFLHQPASIQLGIEKIARKTNQPIFYLKVNVIKRGYYSVDCVPLCLNPKDTKEFEITEMHTRFLEEIIREVPQYWLWSHRRWKHKPVNTF